MKYIFKSIYILLFLAIGAKAYSQTSADAKMLVWEDSLKNLGEGIFKQIAEPERLDNNFKFVKTLVSALKENQSFGHDFTSLKMISIISSPSKDFRIFSWNVPLDDGSYLYYGSVQFKTADGSLKLIPLLDKTFEIQEPEKEALSNNEWYGAQYYELIPLGTNQYALLGWKGHTPTYTQKVIDILTVDKGTVSFGQAVFSDDKALKRKIFNYTREASLILKYESENKRIVFDHLVPADPKLIGNYRYYGPDLSYDAYEIKSSTLHFKENIPLTNPVRGDEDQYLAPDRKRVGKESGI
ncbi:hypothetical protein [Sphingobacterium hungaricum]